MDHDQIPTTTKSPKSEYLQPFVVALLASICGFVYSFYHHSDFLRALALAGIEFLILFWIVLRGPKLVARRENRHGVTSAHKAPSPYRRLSKWGLSVFAFFALIGISLFAYSKIRDANERRAKAEQQRQQEQDDLVIRTRKISSSFYTEMSNNPHPSFEPALNAALAALEFPILSIEKNFPKGPTFVVYKGTAKDAEKIYKALRYSGVPITGYAFMPVE